MSTPVKIGDLESALLERARTLAEEYLANARRTRDQVIADANERLRLREEREILAAKDESERSYRRHVQASEIKQQEELDRLRWQLVQEVMERLTDQLVRIADDQDAYLSLMARFFAKAASSIERDEVIVEINARDHALLARRWEWFCASAGVTKKAHLAEEPLKSLGGIRVRSTDDTIRVDTTIEGRLEHMRDALHQIVMERLFVSTGHLGMSFSG